MNVTQRLQEIDPTLILHNEGHWNEPLDPTKFGYTSFNDAGVETETGEFLYSMARMLKPNHVLETGTHWGVGAAYMGQALKDNNHGMLDTIEFLPEIHKRAQERIAQLGLAGHVTCHFGDVARFEPAPNVMYKLILLDTEPQTRFAEMIKFEPLLEPGGFLFIHDLHQHMHQIENTEHGFAWPYGRLPFEIKQLVTKGQLRPFHFPTPRGLTGFYKIHPVDFIW